MSRPISSSGVGLVVLSVGRPPRSDNSERGRTLQLCHPVPPHSTHRVSPLFLTAPALYLNIVDQPVFTVRPYTVSCTISAGARRYEVNSNYRRRHLQNLSPLAVLNHAPTAVPITSVVVKASSVFLVDFQLPFQSFRSLSEAIIDELFYCPLGGHPDQCASRGKGRQGIELASAGITSYSELNR